MGSRKGNSSPLPHLEWLSSPRWPSNYLLGPGEKGRKREEGSVLLQRFPRTSPSPGTQAHLAW